MGKKKKVSSSLWSCPGTGPSLYLVRSATEQEACKGRRGSIHKSTSLHQQNALWTVLPTSLLLILLELSTMQKRGMWMSKEGASTIIMLLCKHLFAF